MSELCVGVAPSVTLPADSVVITSLPYFTSTSAVALPATDENHESDLDKIKQVYRGAREWNTYEITCRGEELTVKLNGFVVTKAWNIKNSSGHVGIQAEHGLLEFRNLGVKTLE